MKVGHWFLTRFSISDAYQSLCKEFEILEFITNDWLSSIHYDNHSASTFIQHLISANKSRKLKVNAQRIIRDDGRIYLACEGPNLITVYDFWTLVWQENVKAIISLNYPYEERFYPDVYQKNQETIQYWPIINGKIYYFMPFKITCINSSLMADCKIQTNDSKEYVYRLTQLRIRYCNSINPQKDRFLTHVCYLRWPDGQLPLPWGKHNTLAKAANILLQILLMVSDDTILIHCHAGRGRTGVLIALDFAMYQLKNLQTVNIKALIEKIRQRRPGAVMNRWQYAYINIVIAEQAYRMGYLLDRINGYYITRQLINKLWNNLEDDDLYFRISRLNWMELVQKKRSGKGLNWEATFPDEPIGEKSRSFLQRVVFITASHILYTRDLLPAKCFKKRQIEKWKFYVVRAEAEGKDIVHSLKGVMEAIEFAYLRDFIIMVADRDRKDEYEALEVHRITKGEKVATIKYTGIVQARKQFFHLIRRVSAYGNIMGPLPQNICTIFKLTYYDEKTPMNYEPQGFIADEGLFHFPKEIEPLVIGRFDCEKHMVTTSVHSIFMKSATELKSLMHANATKFNPSVSRDSTVCSSPTKTLRTFSTCTDEFSQVQADDTEQHNESMKSAELTASSPCIDISGTLKITRICHTLSSTCDKANCNAKANIDNVEVLIAIKSATDSSISVESSKSSAELDFYENQIVTSGRSEHEGSITPHFSKYQLFRSLMM
ncbi:unnamed protein product [Cercopithifilaria johnstoni]|uniref:Uncharacterized protein n=1 Tax=Cercopithifilaria johnstoni TaxID=2874296 RepID=A0A8J2LX11_9BILA|nr:unnamed protein product [Cercopithifilaria johnstoni]